MFCWSHICENTSTLNRICTCTTPHSQWHGWKIRFTNNSLWNIRSTEYLNDLNYCKTRTQLATIQLDDEKFARSLLQWVWELRYISGHHYRQVRPLRQNQLQSMPMHMLPLIKSEQKSIIQTARVKFIYPQEICKICLKSAHLHEFFGVLGYWKAHANQLISGTSCSCLCIHQSDFGLLR